MTLVTRAFQATCLTLALCAASSPAISQSYPVRPVRIVAPVGPGGAAGVQAEYQLRAAFFPSISLTAVAGLASGALSSLFTAGAFAWSVQHGYGLRAKLAMQAYFNTLARGKVGFTVVDKDAQGRPVYVSDLRGGLERNAMRYYASIESYLHALAAPPQQQLERRLRHWYTYTERYPLQLQEEAGYLDVKRKEAQRAQSQD